MNSNTQKTHSRPMSVVLTSDIIDKIENYRDKVQKETEIRISFSQAVRIILHKGLNYLKS